MLRNGLRSRRVETDLGGDLLGERGEPVGRERVTRERAAQVRAALDEARVERVRPLHVLLDEVLVVLGDRDVEAAVRDDPAAVDRVLAGLVERDELVVLLVVGEVEAGRQANSLECDLPCPLQPLDERRQLLLARGAVPAADADVDGVDLAPADDAS